MNVQIQKKQKNKSENPNLSSRLSTAILPSLLEASIPVRPDDTIIEPRAVNEAHGIFRT